MEWFFPSCVVVQILLVLRVWYVVGDGVTFDGGVCCCRFFASIKVLSDDMASAQ